MQKNEQVGIAVRKVRTDSGLSLRFVADRVGLTYGALQMIEIGTRSLSTRAAKKIGIFLGCDYKALLRGDAIALDGKPYKSYHYKEWQTTRVPASDLDDAIGISSMYLEFLLRAAAVDFSGFEHPSRFREVTATLNQAMADVIEQRGLLDSLNFKMATDPIFEASDDVTLGELRERYSCLPEWKNWDSPEYSEELKLKSKLTEFRLWHPIFGSRPWLKKDTSSLNEIVMKFRIRLQLKADWLPQKVEMEWTEFQCGGPSNRNAVRHYWNPATDVHYSYLLNQSRDDKGSHQE